MSDTETKAAPSNAPANDNDERAVTRIAQSGRQDAEDAAKERASVQPHVLSGPGSGSRLTTSDGNEVTSLDDLHDDTGETIVTVGDDVYEEFAAPGAPNRKIKRLLFHKGQQIPKSVLARHQEALKANADEVKRLAKLGDGTGHEDDPSLDDGGEGSDAGGDGGETKEGAGGAGGETKEGGRGRTPRRS